MTEVKNMIKKIASGILSVLVVLAALTVGVLPAAGDGVDAPAGITVTAKSGTPKDPGKHAEPYTALLAQEINGHYYKYFSLPMTWDDAEAFCRGLGGHLVTISDAAENEAVHAMMLTNEAHIWMGGNDRETEGSFYWITGEPFIYTNWADGEPSNGGGIQHVVQMYVNGQWDDGYTTDAQPFVCEWEPGTFALEPDLESATIYENHRYRLFTDACTWELAALTCQRMGGYLVTISGHEENDFVHGLSQNNNIWLGASDILTEGTFSWVNGEPFSFTYWSAGEPNNGGGNQDGLHMYTNGLWDDDGATFQKAYICEWNFLCLSDTGAFENHDFSEWTTIIPAACGIEGDASRTCTQCGETEHRVLAAKEHIFGPYETVSGSVLIPPIIKTRFCERCRVSETVEDWSYVWVSVVAVVLLIGVVIAVANYAKAFRKK